MPCPSRPSPAFAALEQVKHINQSLWALGTVIERLSSQKVDGGHVPFRDSKLTRLLSDSLGGDCKCAFIATLRPEVENTDEAVGTLRFAMRTKAIRVVVKANVPITSPATMQRELGGLRLELAAARARVLDMEAALARSAEEAEAKAAQAEAKAAAAESKAMAIEAAAATAKAAPASSQGGKMASHLTSALEKMRADRVAAMQTSLAQKERELASVEHQLALEHELRLQRERDAATFEAELHTCRGELAEVEDMLELRTQELRKLRAVAAAADGGGVTHEDTASGKESPPLLSAVQGSSTSLASVSPRRSCVAHRPTVTGAPMPPASGDEVVGLGDQPRGSEADGEAVGMAEMAEIQERYQSFFALASARKLALAARGYEFAHVCLDDLFDAAEAAAIPPSSWGDFLRVELPFDDDDATVGGRGSPPAGLAGEAHDWQSQRIARIELGGEVGSEAGDEMGGETGDGLGSLHPRSFLSRKGSSACSLPSSSVYLPNRPTSPSSPGPSLTEVEPSAKVSPARQHDTAQPGSRGWAVARKAVNADGPETEQSLRLRMMLRQRRREREISGAPAPARQRFSILPEGSGAPPLGGIRDSRGDSRPPNCTRSPEDGVSHVEALEAEVRAREAEVLNRAVSLFSAPVTGRKSCAAPATDGGGAISPVPRRSVWGHCSSYEVMTRSSLAASSNSCSTTADVPNMLRRAATPDGGVFVSWRGRPSGCLAPQPTSRSEACTPPRRGIQVHHGKGLSSPTDGSATQADSFHASNRAKVIDVLAAKVVRCCEKQTVMAMMDRWCTKENARMVFGAVALSILLLLRLRRLGVFPNLLSSPAMPSSADELGDELGDGLGGEEHTPVFESVFEPDCQWNAHHLGCIDMAAVRRGVNGVPCVLRPTLRDWLRCEPDDDSWQKEDGCPAHCIYRVAHALRTECATGGACSPFPF